MTSGDLTFDLALKMTKGFVMIFDALSNAAYRVSLRGPGAEIEGGSLNSPPIHQVVENLEAHQGAG